MKFFGTRFPIVVLAFVGAFFVLAPAAPAVTPGGDNPVEVRRDTKFPLDEILMHLTQQVNTIRDVHFKAKVRRFSEDDGGVEEAFVDVLAIPSNFMRVTFLKPDIFTDMVIALDREQKVVRIYQPVTEEVLVQSMEQAAGSLGAMDSFMTIFSALPRKEFDISLASFDSETSSYVLAMKPRQPQQTGGYFRFWVDPQRWIITRAQRLSKTGKINEEVQVSDLSLNPGITKAQVLEMPNGAEEVRR